jgi:hypothetical protein
MNAPIGGVMWCLHSILLSRGGLAEDYLADQIRVVPAIMQTADSGRAADGGWEIDELAIEELPVTHPGSEVSSGG